jgi:transcription-repair coupling factor (superfamily II helicase)
MRDLSIRGAGNLLGAEQSGFIASVGFDLYSQMLAEEIQKRKVTMLGEEDTKANDWNTVIDLSIDAYLPADYIYDSIQKIEIYKKVAVLSAFDDIGELEDELLDRFGELPEAVLQLLQVARLKLYGKRYGIENISRRGDDVLLKFHTGQEKAFNLSKLSQVGNRFERRVQFNQGSNMVIQVKGKGLTDGELLELLCQFLEAIMESFKLKGELQDVAN